jgi:pyruvate,water dikinase
MQGSDFAIPSPTPKFLAMVGEAWVLDLRDSEACDSTHVGAKAANLAIAGTAGLPVLDGIVLTVEGVQALQRPGCTRVLATLHGAVKRFGDAPLVVRSSSTVEDAESGSMAGQFTSILNVRGWDAIREAVGEVMMSARTVTAMEAPLAVLIQPMLEPKFGGVLFGIDPVTGRTDHRVVAAVVGGPDRLVSGEVDGAQYLLSSRGRVLSSEQPLRDLRRSDLRALVKMAARADRLFGVPQDIEWAIDQRGRLVLLQSRPVTATATTTTKGPLWGTGPLAETFPEPLSTLERDLWIDPLRDGMVNALRLAGAVSAPKLARSDLVTAVGGWVAVDLEAIGVAPVTHRYLRKLDPRPGARRLHASWRVGRLRAAMPLVAQESVDETDARLFEVPALSDLTDEQLLHLLHATQPLLSALHAQEVVCGLLVSTRGAARAASSGEATGASMALWALATGRADGLDDVAIVKRWPAVLALLPPHIGPPRPLPDTPGERRPLPGKIGDDLLAAREQLRMRVRWVQELSARAAWELAQRLLARDRIDDADVVRHLTLAELDTVVRGAPVPDVADRDREAPPPPTTFRLSDDGRPVAVTRDASEARGVSVGRHRGVVRDPSDPDSGDILVVRTLDPSLAPQIEHLGALVAETGSVLSHLAILAREKQIPTVVGVAGATEKFPPGSVLEVDGGTGEVHLVSAGAESMEKVT